MNTLKKSILVKLDYPNPKSIKEIERNENQVLTYLNNFSFKNYDIEFLVLFLIHKNIDPDFEDFENIYFFKAEELFSEWKIVQGDRILNIAIPEKYFGNSDFEILEAHYKCKYIENGAIISIPFSRIQNFKAYKTTKTNQD